LTRKLVFLILVFLPSISPGFAGSAVSLLDDLYRLTSVTVKVTKTEFTKQLWKNPYKIQSFVGLSSHSKMVLYTHLAVENKTISITRQTYYINRFNKIQNGYDLLVKSIINRNNLDNVLKNEFYSILLEYLLSEAVDTINRIKNDEPHPFPEDGSVFKNREGKLPEKDNDYYREYTVKTPGVDDRGAIKIITGKNGEYYYTDDHYQTFAKIVRN